MYRKGLIYFIQLENEDGFIKIGYAHDVWKRLNALQTSSPYKLILLNTMSSSEFPTVETAERFLHAKFSEEHIRGEWFRPSQKLLDFIQSIKPEQETKEFYSSLLIIAESATNDLNQGSKEYRAGLELIKHRELSADIILKGSGWTAIRSQVLHNSGLHVSKKSWPRMVARVLYKAIKSIPIETIRRDVSANTDLLKSETYRLLSKEIKRLSVM